MNLPSKSRKLFFPLTLALASSSAFAQSSTVFSYGPSEDYVSDSRTFDRTASTSYDTPGLHIAKFSLSEPLLRPAEMDYSGPTLFGGYQFHSTNSQAIFPAQQIRHRDGKPDSITLQSYSQESWAGSELSLQAVFLFKQSDFNPEFKTGAISPNGFSITWASYFKGDERNVEGRYVVQINEKLYVSAVSFSMTNSGSNYLTATVLATTKWAPYQAASDLNFDAGRASYQALPLKRVTAAGVYVEEDRWLGDNSVAAPYLLSVTAFKVTGTAQ